MHGLDGAQPLPGLNGVADPGGRPSMDTGSVAWS